MADSVELATILLTDLVGSTRLANSVGPVRADELREEHFELLRDAIAFCGGREVKNTGDGLMVAFASASAAVECAVAMQQRFEHRYRKAEQALHVRIGLGAGESTVKDADYFGMPSIVAARLCAQAPADSILASRLVETLAGRCEGIEFSSAGHLELKGFENPVEALLVAWTPLAEEEGAPSRWPLPALLRSVPPVKYVGRVEERAALEEAMALARTGQRQVVLLSGEPGIGKTRLASYAAHHAHAEGFVVAWGACSEELAVPYEPWIEVCSQIVERVPEELLAAHVRRHGGELSRVARNIGERVADLSALQSSDPETERYLLFNAVAGLLGEVAEMVPVCVVLDDLHWADAQSLALLKHVLRESEQGSLQAIGTYRDSDLGKNHPLTAVLADLRSLQGVQRIGLHGLSAEDIAEVMTAIAGHELAQDGVELAAQIAEETGGNPFFAGEILNGLREAGTLVFDEHKRRWRLDRSGALALPESVREVIERRVDRLGEETLAALRLAAVIGREFDLQLLAAVVEMDEARLLDRLEAAVAASVLAESDQVGRFRFAHALINQTLYEGLGATRRARMHQHVAEALEVLYGADPGEHLGELALHWRLATVSVDKAKAANYALKAGRRALENLAPADAAKFFSDSLELLGPAEDAERCLSLIGLGEAQQLSGDAAYRKTLLEASRTAAILRDGNLAARAALANTRGLMSTIGHIDEERVDAIERALELDDRSDPGRRAQLLALQSQELFYEHDRTRRQALASEAIALAREVGDARVRARVLQHAIPSLWSPDTVALRASLTDELLDSVRATGDRAAEFWAQFLVLHVSMETCDFGRAQLARDRLQELAAALAQPTLSWAARVEVTAGALLTGDLAAAGRLSRACLELGMAAGQPDALQIFGEQRGLIRMYQGRGDAQLIELVRQAAKDYPHSPAWEAATAQYESHFGSSESAAAILRDAVENRLEQVGWGYLRLVALTFYAEAAAHEHARDAAELVHELLAPWRDQFVWDGNCGYGHVRLWLGVLAATLGWDREADEHFVFACRFHDENGHCMWSGRAHLGWAEALAARGDPAAAREHAARALELSREYGYGLFEPRAAALAETQSGAGI